jgi:hypothetical protein
MFLNFEKSSGTWKKTVELPGKRIMRRSTFRVWLNSFRFCATIDFLRSYQKIYVIAVGYFCFIHISTLPDFYQLRNS